MQQFEGLLRRYTGDSNVKLSKKAVHNNLTKAITSGCMQFGTLKRNFRRTVSDLSNFFRPDAKKYNEFIKILRRITNPGVGWSGAWAELVAMNYFASFKDIQLRDFALNLEFEAKESLAQFGDRKTLDIDFRIKTQFSHVNIDVKSYKNVVAEIFNDQIDAAIQSSGIQAAVIPEKAPEHTFENILSLSGDSILRERLQTEIERALKNGEQRAEVLLDTNQTLPFTIRYGPSITFTESTHHPERDAERIYLRFLKDYNKLLIKEPVVLLFVTNPWWPNELLSGKLSNFDYFRAIARRLFIEGVRDMRRYNAVFRKREISDALRICDVARQLSGIMFMEDRSVTDRLGLPESYLFLNPNAAIQIRRGYQDFEFLSWGLKPGVPRIVDFTYDNY